MNREHLFARRVVWSLLLAGIFTFGLFAQNAVSKARADSLERLLKRLESPEKQLSIMKKQVSLYWQLPQEVPCLERIIELATRLDSMAVVYNAMGGLARYYYNADQTDSLVYWASRIEALAGERGDLPDALFASGSLICQENLWKGNYEIATNEAIRLLNLAKKRNQPYALARIYRDLGLIYQTINRDSDAVAIFRQGWKWLNAITPPKPTFKVMFLADMLVSTIRLDLFEESFQLLEDYREVVDELEASYKSSGRIFPVGRHRWRIDLSYAELYLRKKQWKKVREYLEKTKRYDRDESGNEYVRFRNDRVHALYYYQTGRPLLALEAVDKALEEEQQTELFKLKADILRSLGRTKEALEVYKTTLAMNKDIENKAFGRQIAQLRNLNDLNGMEKQARELAYQAERISLKQRQLIGAVLFIGVLLVLLYVLIRYYRRANRLKNELLKEKDSLVKSEKELRLMTEKAQQANQVKTAFISNISHEVRTPLNAIVGFSELLLDETESAAQRAEFAQTINQSSELLLNLINDVLDLSRLESGRIQFTCQPVDLVDYCRRALDGIAHRVGEKVKLTFTSPVEAFELRTDPMRLQQLITHLLSNAAKFTEEGEINVALSIEEADNRVVLSVTDTGCGIPPEKQERIFERFEKLDEFKQGTGLGLSICRIIADQLQGSIAIDSSYTAGARFVFIHPLH